MNSLLVGGLGAFGLAAGPFLDELGARIPPSVHQADEDVSHLPKFAPKPPEFTERVTSSLVCGGILAGLAIRVGAKPELSAFCVLALGLVAISVADFRVHLIPKKFVYPTLLLEVLALLGTSFANNTWHRMGRALLGGIVPFAIFFVIWFVIPKSMGFGDVRLALVIGMAMGWVGFLPEYIGFALSFVMGTLFGIVKMIVQRTGRKTTLPFGPGMAIGAVVVMLYGAPLAHSLFPHVR